jgi:phosphohistidine phosphatase
LALRGIKPELILSSCALRAQQTADLLAKKIDFDGVKHYLEELYLSSLEEMKDIIMVQDNSVDAMFLIGHNPQLHELINTLVDEHINKLPTLGVVAIEFDISQWSEIEDTKGRLDFFIFPKQFKYYMPRQIRGLLED